MLNITIYIEIAGQLLAILAGIWFVRANFGVGSYIFLTGTVVSFLGISLFTFVDTPISRLVLDGKPNGEILILITPALGQLLIGIGGCMLAYRLMGAKKKRV